MKILFYGRLAEAVGAEMAIGASNGRSIAELRDRLAADHPAIAEELRNKRARTCVGGTLVPDEYRLELGDTVEFLPPVSGG